MEAKVGDYRLQMEYDRIYDSVKSVISNTSNNIYGVALSENASGYLKYMDYIPDELYEVAKDFIEQTMKERNIDEDDVDQIDIRDAANYCYSQRMAKFMKITDYGSSGIWASEVDDAYKASLMFYVDHKYDGYDAELGYVFKDVKNYIEGNNVMVMPQKYVEWTSTDKQVMTEWEDICTAWMGFVIPINKDGVENIIQSIVDDGIIHPDSKEIEKMRKAFLNSDNHYFDDY
jgi:hypothetical protein